MDKSAEKNKKERKKMKTLENLSMKIFCREASLERYFCTCMQSEEN